MLKKLKPLFIVIFLFLSFSGTTQEVILLKGKIQADSLEGSSINIINISKDIGTTNNSLGQFAIEVEEGDTLLFSSVQYKIRKVFMSNEILKKNFLEVTLENMVNELEEVNISNSALSGNLTTDLYNIETFDQASVGFPLSALSRKNSVERKIYTASSTSFDLILNMLNGRLKMLKKAKEMMEYESYIDLGVEIFPTDFYTDYIHIPKDKIRLFIYYCGEDRRFKKILIRREALELIEFYFEKAEEFLKLNENGEEK